MNYLAWAVIGLFFIWLIWSSWASMKPSEQERSIRNRDRINGR